MTQTAEFSYDDDWDLAKVLRRLRAGWRWIVALAVLGGVSLAAYAAIAPTVYRATTVLLPGGAESAGLSSALSSALGSFGGLASLAGVSMPSGSPNTEEAIAVLRSRQFSERFIERRAILPQLFPDEWDANLKTWKQSGRGAPTMSEAIRRFNLLRGVSTDRKTGLISVTVKWRDPQIAAAWANALVDDVNAEMRQRAVVHSDAALAFLRRELELTGVVGTRDAINRLIEAQVNQRMLANVTPEFAFRVVDRAPVPDRYDIVAPRRAMLIASGLFVGMFVGAVIALVAGARAAARS